MLVDFISLIGRKAIRAYKLITDILSFIYETLKLILKPSSYDGATNRVLIRQIYFTSIQVLPYFLTLSLFFGATLVGLSTGALKKMNLLDSLGEAFFAFVVIEIAPFFTVILLSLRSATAMSSEIAIMKVNNEIDTLKAFGINPNRYIALPRIVAGVVSMVILSFLFATISIGGGVISSFLFFGTSVKGYMYLVINNFVISDFLYLLIKSIFLAIVMVMIPIYSALRTPKKLSAVPISVSNGMVRLFDAIILIEVVTLTLRFL